MAGTQERWTTPPSARNKVIRCVLSFIMIGDTSNSVIMKIVSARRPGSVIGRVQGISRLAKARLKWLDHYRGHGENAALTCRHFGISRQTFYRWKRRYNPRDLTSLDERRHRPRCLGQPTWSRELALAVLGNTEALHRQGGGVPLGCGGGAHQSHREHRHGLSKYPAGPDALPRTSYTGGRRLRVPGGL